MEFWLINLLDAKRSGEKKVKFFSGNQPIYLKRKNKIFNFFGSGQGDFWLDCASCQMGEVAVTGVQIVRKQTNQPDTL